MATPKRRLTAMRTTSSSMQRPIDDSERACSHAPDSGQKTTRRRGLVSMSGAESSSTSKRALTNQNSTHADGKWKEGKREDD